MKNKKLLGLANELQEGVNEYWSNVTLDDIITIKTKPIKTPYVSREGETFTAVRLPKREITGMPSGQYIRCFRLDRDRVVIEMLPLDRILSINGKEIHNKTEWKVKNSKGNGYYIIKLIGEQYVCNCTGYKFRKRCKHSESIKNNC